MDYLTIYRNTPDTSCDAYGATFSESEFVSEVVETMLWAEMWDTADYPPTFHSVSQEVWDALAADCGAFLWLASGLLAQCEDSSWAFHPGHDFWLTRNGHGSGFWDGDYPEPQATALTQIARAFGEVFAYVGDDGMVYL